MKKIPISSHIPPAIFPRHQPENLRHIPWADESASLPIYWPDVVVLVIVVFAFFLPFFF